MSRNEITYVETGERLIGLSKEAMRNIRLWMLLEVYRFELDLVKEYVNDEVKFNSFEDFANYLEDELEGIYGNDEVYEYVRGLCNVELDKDGYEWITYELGHRPVELNCDPITYLKKKKKKVA